MHRMAVLLAAAACLRGGTIQGIVLEQMSGRPLARAAVRLDPVPGPSGGRPLATRAGRTGHFVFSPVPPGLYLLTATSAGYFPGGYGQRLPTGRGTPISVTDDSDLFAELRMRHKGAITGRVLDENGVGKPGVPVMAYRARLPLRSAGTALSDDRGVFRIHGLDPGRYWVRSASHMLEDGSGWLPTFAPQARVVGEARAWPVSVDSDSTDADLSPEPGTLFRLGGQIGCDREGPVTVTLSSETGRRSVSSACHKAYQFEGLSPGIYEVFAATLDGSAAGFTEVPVERDSDAGGVQLMQIPLVQIEVRRSGERSRADLPVTITGRRQDLSESGTEREMRSGRAALAPGHWELRARAPRGYYVQSIVNLDSPPRRLPRAERAADWFEVFIAARWSATILVTLSDRAARITGRVVADGKAAAGATVFLWPAAEDARRSLGGAPQALSDTEGRFQFESLPPGDYRLFASFDVTEVDEELIESSRTPGIRAESSQTAAVDLPLWIAPW